MSFPTIGYVLELYISKFLVPRRFPTIDYVFELYICVSQNFSCPCVFLQLLMFLNCIFLNFFSPRRFPTADYVLELAFLNFSLLGVFLQLVMSLNCISLITATMVMNIKRRAQHEPIPTVSPWLLNLCEKYLSKITCTTLSDWKRMAEAPDESNMAAGIEEFELNQADDDENDTLDEQYMEMTPTDTMPSSSGVSPKIKFGMHLYMYVIIMQHASI